MKSAAKTFIIIGMILGAFWIFPIVVGSLALSKISAATRAEELKTMGILTALFCSLLGGIFMCCIKDEELAFSYATSAEGTTLKPEKRTLNYQNSADAISQLEKLKKLYDEGILTEEEFNSKKTNLLKEI